MNPENSNWHKIRSLTVSGGFLDDMHIEFGENLNCIIGGRGTGKTTVLELIRWALDQMPDQSDESAKYRNISRLIQANLGTGQVSLEIETLTGIRYRVQRGCDDESIVVGDNGEPVGIEIGRGNIFSAEIYSQNDIEEIANDPLFQLKLIDNFIAEKIKDLNAKTQTSIRELDANALDIVKLRQEIVTLKEQVSELPEITEKLKAFKIEEGGEEARALQREGQAKAIRDQEKRCIVRLQQVLSETRNNLEGAISNLHEQVAECFGTEILNGPNAGLIREIKTLTDGNIRDVIKQVGDAVRLVSTTESNLPQKTGELEAAHTKQEKAYQDLLGKYAKEKDKAKERDQLLRRQAELQEGQKKLEKRNEELQKKQNTRQALLRRLSDMKDERYRLRTGVAQAISSQLGPTIRVRIEQFGNTDAYRDLLMESMKGSGFKYTQVVDRLVQRIPPHEFAAIVLRADAQTLMDHLELDADRANRIILQLKDSKTVFDVEVVELHDRPTIELQDGADYKDSTTLSTGQKCTTILPILLLESARPLLIDQPEDNLDNAFIYETIVKSLRGVQGKRQLIFVTHNPNIPVLGDAQCMFVLQSTGRQASLKATGTVDQVKNDIETILEGGKVAFQKRKERYGY